jgi:hypothetical protein
MKMSESNKPSNDKVPEEFSKVIKDFTRDIKATFPEVGPLINKWWKEASEFDYIDDEEERNKAVKEYDMSCVTFLFGYCQKKFPLRFFEILYQNDEMFKEDSTVDTEFLPHIHFKNLWQFDITQKTRDTIWKYLQLILFSVVGTLDNREAFGDTAKLFEAINEDEFKTKLEETLKQMEGLFNTPPSADDENNDNTNKMPNANDIHDHITGMLDGQLGKLAKEIAEETAQDLNMDMENVTDMKDVFNNLIKNPTKLMGLVKNVGEKLDTKIKSGDIKESELIAEATEIMNKMKNMPGMDNIQSMLSKMGLPGLGGKNGGKVNMSAMESQLNKNMKNAKMKERMKEKHQQQQLQQMLLQQQQLQQQDQQKQPKKPDLTDEQIISIFSTGEKVDRTPRGATMPTTTTTTTSSKKKKPKKK